MKVIFLTIFPEIIESYFSVSMMAKAIERSLIEYKVINIRDFSEDKHKKVDDYVFGGGSGMLFKPDVVYSAIEYSKKILPNSKTVYMSAKGRLLNKDVLKEYLEIDELIVLSGRYEGVDERIIDNFVDDEICIGDYVVTGGELPSLVFIDALVRLKGLIKSDAIVSESFFYEGWLLEYDQYTRPREFKGFKVPEVLIKGNHKEIEKWRHLSSLVNTYQNRPDLLRNVRLSREDVKVLSDFLFLTKGLKNY
ncbi:MAG: tRNA (guanosine(37)-N1)-methyltransferase TrmD [Brevinematia bacterium]